MDGDCIQQQKRKRVSPMTEMERMRLICLVKEHKSSLLCHDNKAESNKRKIRDWEMVCCTMNSRSTVVRTVAQIKTAWDTISRTCREEISQSRKAQRQTGGGAVPELSALAKVVEEIYGKESAVLSGIGGFQSGDDPQLALHRMANPTLDDELLSPTDDEDSLGAHGGSHIPITSAYQSCGSWNYTQDGATSELRESMGQNSTLSSGFFARAVAEPPRETAGSAHAMANGYVAASLQSTINKPSGQPTDDTTDMSLTQPQRNVRTEPAKKRPRSSDQCQHLDQPQTDNAKLALTCEVLQLEKAKLQSELEVLAMTQQTLQKKADKLDSEQRYYELAAEKLRLEIMAMKQHTTGSYSLTSM